MTSFKPNGKKLLLLSLFFFSGFSGLIYQVLWMRQFKVVLGSSIISVSTVVASFMLGLLIGSWLIGKKFAKRIPFNELRAYGLLEMAIGIYGLLLLFLLPSAIGLYGLFSDPELTFGAFSILFKAALTILLLLIPTAAMGATLPLMVNHFSKTSELFRKTTGQFYAINALGGAVAAFISGFVLIKALGVSNSIGISVAINLIIGVLALLKSRSPVELNDSMETFSSTNNGLKESQVFLVTAFLTGFIAIAFEMLWIRCLNYLINNSTYTFSLILFVFLAGISIGSWLASVIRRIQDKKLAFSIIQLAIVVFSILIIYLFYDLAYSESFGELFLQRTDDQVSWYENVGLNLYFALMVFLGPAILMGISFPLLSDLYYETNQRGSGFSISRVFMLNTWGSLFGALIPVFLLIPLLNGLKNTLYFISALNLCIALYYLFISGHARKYLFVFSAIAVLGMMAWTTKSNDVLASLEGLNDDAIEDNIFFYQEGTMATVKVYDRQGSKSLSIDGVTIASESFKAKESAIGHFPFFTGRKINNVLMVGLASGSTLRSTLLHDEVRRVDVVEIVPGVINAVRYFDESGENVLQNDKVNVYVDDIISYLNYTPKKYDVISSDGKFGPLNKANTTMLSEDYYKLCEAHLNEKGIFIQWITTEIPNKHFTTILNTTRSVFPYTEMFLNRKNLFIISGKNPLAVQYDRIVAAFENPEIRSELHSMVLYSPAAVLSTYVGPNLSNQQNTSINSFNHPVIEYDYEKEHRVDIAESRTSAFRNLNHVYELYLNNQANLADGINTIAANDSIISFESNRRFLESRIAYFRGHFSLFDQKPDKAMKFFAEVVALNHPENENDIAVSAKYLGEYNLQLGLYEKSIEYFDTSVQKLDGYSDAFTLRGIAYFNLGDTAKSMADFNTALELNPNDQAAAQYLELK